MNDIIRAAALVVNFLTGSISLGVLLYFFYTRSDKSIDPFHQKLAIGILSIAVTTMVVVIALMLPTNALGELSGRTGFVTFTLAGPPAIWVMIFVITAKV